MTSIQEYINSGILEQFVLGCTTDEEAATIAAMATEHAAVAQEIVAIREAIEAFAMEHAVTPNAVIKPFLLATIDYTERLKNGEAATFPPLLHEQATIKDYAPWLNRNDMVYTGNEDIYARIIGYTPEVISAIIWINNYTPQEVHHNEYEKFLVVEGSCEIMIEDEVHQLVPGDYFMIPLYKNHVVHVTSNIACKIILQRVAA